jgi:PTH1 family peptidyl-tRNA hydrolase
MSIKLIVGLGNYPIEYHETRHNIGFMVIDEVCRELKLILDQDKYQGLFTKVKTDKDEFIIAKPQTYMNLSGNFVQPITHFYKIKPEDILIISDDVDLSVGSIRIKPTGSSGGQNGVKDIINKLGSENIPRIKIGIGRPSNKNIMVANYVLSKFTVEERDTINKIVKQVAGAVIKYMNGTSVAKLMNEYNFTHKSR